MSRRVIAGKLTALVTSVGLLAAVAACSGNPTPSSPKTLGSVSFQLTSDWDSLAPNASLISQGAQAILPMYDRLVYQKGNGSVGPYIAKSWTEGPGKVTFEVRTDATCADGTPVTSQVIAASFRSLFDPASTSKVLTLVKSSLGPRPWTATADDATHVTITVANPVTNLASVMAKPWASIICPAGLQASADYAKQSYGSGPYTLVSAVHGYSVVLKKRGGWTWGPPGTDAAALPTDLTFRVVTESTTAANLVTAGGLDVAEGTGVDLRRLLDDKSLTVVKAQPLLVENALANERPTSPTSDKTLRLALQTAIDREEYALAKGSSQPAATSIASGSFSCYNESVKAQLPQPSIAKAREILTGIGYTTTNGKLTKDGKPLTIRLLADADLGAGADYINAQWTELGVNVVYSKLPKAQWVTKLLALDFDVALQKATDLSAALNNWLGDLHPAGPNIFGIINSAALTHFTATNTAATDKDRCDAWKTVQADLISAHDVWPLAEQVQHYFTRGITFESLGSGYAEIVTMAPAA